MNPDAAGKGLNIQGANHVIHFNPEWNPALTNQATARAYRRGQELPVFVSHFYYRNTIEQHVVEKAAHKRILQMLWMMGQWKGKSCDELTALTDFVYVCLARSSV